MNLVQTVLPLLGVWLCLSALCGALWAMVGLRRSGWALAPQVRRLVQPETPLLLRYLQQSEGDQRLIARAR